MISSSWTSEALSPGEYQFAVRAADACGNEEASDSLQDALISAYRRADSFRGDSAVTTWLHRIVVNAALMKLRSKRRRPEDASQDLVLRIAQVPDTGAQSESRWLLGRLFAHEQASTREIAVMHLLDGLTLEEVAKEVARDLVPKPVLIGGIILIVILILLFFLL